jgi:hypothetical protein
MLRNTLAANENCGIGGEPKPTSFYRAVATSLAPPDALKYYSRGLIDAVLG